MQKMGVLQSVRVWTDKTDANVVDPEVGGGVFLLGCPTTKILQF